MFFRRQRKKRDFFELLCLQMENIYDGVKVLDSFFHTGEGDASERLCELEHQADDFRRFIIDDLNQTFITPIDRKDIYSLSRSIDDIIDISKAIIEEIEVFEVIPNQYMRMISTTLKHATSKLYDSIGHLKDRPNLSQEAAIRSNLLLNNMEHLYFEAIKDLAESGRDIPELFKLREVFHRLLDLSRAINSANNILLDIIIKTY